MRVCFFTATPYQLIVALQLKKTVYVDAQAELIIYGSLCSNSNIKNKLLQLDVFDNVYALERDESLEVTSTIGVSSALKKYLKDSFGTNSKLTSENSVDEFLFANISGPCIAIANYFLSINKNLELSMFEDGVSSYSRLFEMAISKKINNDNIIKRFIFKLFPQVLAQVQNYYVFHPDLMAWECPFTVKKIPNIDKTRDDLRTILNKVFEYDKMVDTYEEDVIFFEESYVADGIEVEDVDIVNRLAEIYGKDRIFVKTHPRNKINRFSELGYKTNKEREIPWELIMLNIPIDDKVLVSMTSTAVVNSFLLFNSKAKMYLIYDRLDNYNNDRIKYTIEVIKLIENKYPERINTKLWKGKNTL